MSISNGSSSSSRSGSNRSPFTQTWCYKRLHIIIAEIGAPHVPDTGSFIGDLTLWPASSPASCGPPAGRLPCRPSSTQPNASRNWPSCTPRRTIFLMAGNKTAESQQVPALPKCGVPAPKAAFQPQRLVRAISCQAPPRPGAGPGCPAHAEADSKPDEVSLEEAAWLMAGSILELPEIGGPDAVRAQLEELSRPQRVDVVRAVCDSSYMVAAGHQLPNSFTDADDDDNRPRASIHTYRRRPGPPGPGPAEEHQHRPESIHPDLPAAPRSAGAYRASTQRNFIRGAEVALRPVRHS